MSAPAGRRRPAPTCWSTPASGSRSAGNGWAARGSARRPGRPCASFFTVPQTAAVARTVFVYAWSLVVNHSAGARLILGIHPHCASLLGACTVSQVHELAERGCGWLRPRWLKRVRLWRQMLVAAAEDDVAALERARMQGLQMLAAEAWDGAHQSRLGGLGLRPVTDSCSDVDQAAQRIGRHRLDQVVVDTRTPGAQAIVFLTVAGDRDEHGILGRAAARAAARPPRSHPCRAARCRGIPPAAATAPRSRARSGRHRRRRPRDPTSRAASTCSRRRPCCHRRPAIGASTPSPRSPCRASAIALPSSIDVDLPQPARVAGAPKHAFGAEFRDDPPAAGRSR